ncbi:unnamed protein product [Malus baccata var. baccata]
MFTRPIVKGQIGKWTMAFSKFILQYIPQKAVKGQALADFLAQHPSPYEFEGNDVDIGLATRVLVLGDSELVINQLNETFRCMSCTLAPYHMVTSYLTKSFDDVTFKHISRVHNIDADELAQIAFGAQLMGGKSGREIPVLRQAHSTLINQRVLQRDCVIRTWVMPLPSLLERKDTIEVYAIEALPDD